MEETFPQLDKPAPLSNQALVSSPNGYTGQKLKFLLFDKCIDVILSHYFRILSVLNLWKATQ